MKKSVIIPETIFGIGVTHLVDDGCLLTSEETDLSTNHAEQSEENSSESSTSLGVALECANRVSFGGVDESENLLAEEADGILLENDLLNVLVLDNRFVSLINSDLERLLDVKGLSSQLLGVLDGMADVKIVEEDVLSHSPEFDTDTTLESKKSIKISFDNSRGYAQFC